MVGRQIYKDLSGYLGSRVSSCLIPWCLVNTKKPVSSVYSVGFLLNIRYSKPMIAEVTLLITMFFVLFCFFIHRFKYHGVLYTNCCLRLNDEETPLNV